MSLVYEPRTGRAHEFLERRWDGLSIYQDVATGDRTVCKPEFMDAYPCPLPKYQKPVKIPSI